MAELERNWPLAAELRLLHGSELIFVALDESAHTLYLNPAGTALLERSLDEMRHADWFDLVIPEEDRPTVRQELQRLITSGVVPPLPFENVIQSRSGRRHTIRWHSTLASEPGAPVHIVSIGVNITDLRESEGRFRQMFRASPVPMSLSAFDDGTYIDVNPAFERITQYKRDELIGRDAKQIRLITDPGVRPKMIAGLKADGLVRGLKYRFRRADGTPGTALMGAAVFEQGGVPKIVAVHQDMTDEEVAREHLLRTSQDLARINRELVQIAQAAAHDLAEPAREVSLLSTILHRRLSDQDPEILRDLQAVHDGAKRLYRMVGDLLRFTEIGLAPPNAELVNLDKLMHQAVQDAKAETGLPGTVTWDDLPTIPGDHQALLVLFTELLKNALMAARPGQPLEVTIDAMADEDGSAHVRLRDNGRGFNTAYADHVFGLFRRLGPKDEAHSGVGLAIVRRIAELHGGWLTIDSTEGDGTTIRVWLNIAPRDPLP